MTTRVRRIAGAASCVRDSGRFVARELRGSQSVAQYRLRGSGLVAQIRHPLLDMWVLEEIFRRRVYEPPPAAARALASLRGPMRVVDLGGHVGLFGLYVCGTYGDATVLSYEPDPANGALLERSIEANRLGERWRLVKACAASHQGSVSFDSSGPLSRANPEGDHALEEMQLRIGETFPFLRGTALLSPERVQVESRDVFPELVRADFLKIDVEGAEWDLFADPRFEELRAAAVVLEYHPSYGPGEDSLAVLRRALKGAGLEVGAPAWNGDAGMVWAWRAEAATS